MKKLVWSLLACCVVLRVSAAEEEWMTDLPKTQAKAKTEKKLVLMDFTGSDWCPPCKQLRKTVLDSTEFKEYAKQNLMLVEIDFPKNKSQSDALKTANKQLSQRFNISGFPTVVLLDANGKELGRQVGYGGENPKNYIAKIDSWRNK